MGCLQCSKLYVPWLQMVGFDSQWGISEDDQAPKSKVFGGRVMRGNRVETLQYLFVFRGKEVMCVTQYAKRTTHQDRKISYTRAKR